ncbi:NAD(P)/FAD-dependent oxidoreductase [Hyphobacterium sp.]|uniref:NAD(P)/FAD-dependent oxidoreductase n=1 Tax=Hyphobacterium sp. TaxID=2004662 RepID=UPI003B515E0F
MTVKSTSRARIAIVGGGIAGLACAFELSRRGLVPTVIEAGRAGEGALWASGGMLAAAFESAESDASPDMAALARRGLELWRDWSELLEQDAIGYRSAGSVSPASGAAGRAWLERLSATASRLGFRADPVTPPTGIKADAALRFPEDGELDNRLLGQRLVSALRAAGVKVHENRAVTAIEEMTGSGVELTCGADKMRFDAAVLSTGHDTRLATVDPACNAILPVRGEMLSVGAQGLTLPGCIRAQAVYLSQKPDRRIVIGATSEAGSSDLAVDSDAISILRDRAVALFPGLAGAPEVERWAGIRPGTRDGHPILGESSTPGVFLALGLYRNGVLFSPAVAEVLADAVLGGRPVAASFSARRFDER